MLVLMQSLKISRSHFIGHVKEKVEDHYWEAFVEEFTISLEEILNQISAVQLEVQLTIPTKLTTSSSRMKLGPGCDL